jgi:hypothetical protein
MAIVKFLIQSSAIQFFAFVVATTVLFISIGEQYDLTKSEWASWAQAYGAFIAIIAAGSIANAQARSQFKASVRLQRAEYKLQVFHMAEAVHAISERVTKNFHEVCSCFPRDPLVFSWLRYGLMSFDRKLLDEMESHLREIPLHELLSADVVEQVIVMRSTIRLAVEKTNEALSSSTAMNSSNFDEFFQFLGETQDTLNRCTGAIKKVKMSLKADIDNLSII